MNSEESLTLTRLKAPKAAAIAGILFSILLTISLALLLLYSPANLHDGRDWLSIHGNKMLLAFNLVPFSGIAFLWFMGVVRDRLGRTEDLFLSTVFLGSGLLFLALLFVLSAISSSVIGLYINHSNRLLASAVYDFGFGMTREIMNNYTVRIAGVFMISTSTLFIRSRVIPRWMAFLGYALAFIMLLRISYIDRIGWVILAFPLWILLISIYILLDNYRKRPRSALVT